MASAHFSNELIRFHVSDDAWVVFPSTCFKNVSEVGEIRADFRVPYTFPFLQILPSIILNISHNHHGQDQEERRFRSVSLIALPFCLERSGAERLGTGLVAARKTTSPARRR
jgi:hypothetical protein